MAEKVQYTIRKVEADDSDTARQQTSVEGDPGKREKLVSDIVGVLLGATRSLATSTFDVEWEGYHVPIGAVIDGHEIAWTQHGVVYSVDHYIIGTYDQPGINGGDNGQHQKMRVYMNEQPDAE